MAAPRVASDSAKPSTSLALPKIEYDGSQARCSVAIKKDTALTSSGQSRQAQAAYRQRQKDRMVGLEEKVQLLEKQLSSLGMDCIRYKAQRDALSHAFFSIQSAGPASADDKAQGEDISNSAASSLVKVLRLLRGPAAASVTAANCRRVSVDSMANVIMESMQRYQQLLDAGANVPGSPQAEQLDEIYTQTKKFTFGVWKSDARLMGKMLSQLSNLLGSTSKPHHDLPRNVLAVMDLSSEQKDAIVAAHKSLLEQLSSIYVINQALPDALMGRTSISTVSSAAPPTLVLQACLEVSSQLEDTTLAKMTAMREFAIACYLKILTPLQVARGELYSCPHIMDITAVAGCLAKERENSNALGNDTATAEMLEWISGGMGTEDAYLLEDSNLQLEGAQSPPPSAAISSWPMGC